MGRTDGRNPATMPVHQARMSDQTNPPCPLEGSVRHGADPRAGTADDADGVFGSDIPVPGAAEGALARQRTGRSEGDRSDANTCGECGASLGAAFICKKTPCPREDRAWAKVLGAGS